MAERSRRGPPRHLRGRNIQPGQTRKGGGEGPEEAQHEETGGGAGVHDENQLRHHLERGAGPPPGEQLLQERRQPPGDGQGGRPDRVRGAHPRHGEGADGGEGEGETQDEAAVQEEQGPVLGVARSPARGGETDFHVVVGGAVSHNIGGYQIFGNVR